MKLNNGIGIVFDEVKTAGKGRHFTSRFIEPGLVNYANSGVLKVSKATLDKFCQSLVGCPVTIEHKDLTNENANERRKGAVSNVWYDSESGWYCCEGVIWDPEAIDLVENGWTVSCTYEVLATTNEGGEWHNMSYDDELLDGRLEYLALVPNPRYEEATILLNSKEDRKEMFAKLFNSKKIRKSNNEGKDMKKDNEESVDKNKLKDQIIEMAKKGLNDDEIKELNEKLDMLAYEKSESEKSNSDDEDEKDEKSNSEEEEKKEEDKKDNKCNKNSDEDSEEDKKSEEDEKSNSDEEEDKKSEEDDKSDEEKSNEDDKEDEEEKDKKDNSKSLKKLHNSGSFEAKSNFVSEKERLALGDKLF